MLLAMLFASQQTSIVLSAAYKCGVLRGYQLCPSPSSLRNPAFRAVPLGLRRLPRACLPVTTATGTPALPLGSFCQIGPPHHSAHRLPPRPSLLCAALMIGPAPLAWDRQLLPRLVAGARQMAPPARPLSCPAIPLSRICWPGLARAGSIMATKWMLRGPAPCPSPSSTGNPAFRVVPLGLRRRPRVCLPGTSVVPRSVCDGAVPDSRQPDTTAIGTPARLWVPCVGSGLPSSKRPSCLHDPAFSAQP